MNKSAQKALVAIFILMFIAPLSGALAQTTNPTWNLQTVDPLGGAYSSLALDSYGNPHISYVGSNNTDNNNPDLILKYASWNGSTLSVQDIAATEAIGLFSSIALDKNGNPQISYYKGISLGTGALMYTFTQSFPTGSPTETGTSTHAEYIYAIAVGVVVVVLVLAVLLLQRKRRVKNQK